MNLFRDIYPAIGFTFQTFTPITEGLTSFFNIFFYTFINTFLYNQICFSFLVFYLFYF